MERQNFEKSWKDAFDGAEVTPSDNVWTNVELDLEKERAGGLRRRLFFYQMLAAASVVFAMAIGGTAIYFNHGVWPSSSSGPLAANDNSVTTPENSLQEVLRSEGDQQQPADKDEHTAGTSLSAAPSDPGLIAAVPDRRTLAGTKNANVGSLSRGAEEEPIAEEPGTVSSGLTYGEGLTALRERPLPPLYTPRDIEPVFPTTSESVDPVAAMLAKLERQELRMRGGEEQKEERSQLDENLWTSVGFAAGSFNSMQASSPSAPAPASFSSAMAVAAPILDNETKASGYSYSVGVNVGTRLSERWVLQGGVNYLTQASEYTANNVVVSTTAFQQQRYRAVSTNELINANPKDLSNKIVYSAPYDVNNNMRYLSVPLQAGYLLVNKTFGLQLNAGVATDLFLQNTVTPQTDQIDKTTQPAGTDSPYRSLNFSGLVGTEFSYRFGGHYRIALNPGLRYPFNTIYKSELGVDASPLTFDVGLRFRYIFR